VQFKGMPAWLVNVLPQVRGVPIKMENTQSSTGILSGLAVAERISAESIAIWAILTGQFSLTVRVRKGSLQAEYALAGIAALVPVANALS
jgi:hypothetical protein